MGALASLTASARADGLLSEAHFASDCTSDTGCCQLFSFFSDSLRTELDVDLTGDPSATTSCLNLSCLLSNPGYTVSVTTVSSNHVHLVFRPAGANTDLPLWFDFTICHALGSAGCEGLWDHFSWISYDNGVGEDTGSSSMSWCYSGFNCGSGCDIVSAFNYPNAVEFCVRRTSLTSANQIRITIEPPQDCMPQFQWDGDELTKRYEIGDTVPLVYDTCVYKYGVTGGYDSCWSVHSFYITDTVVPSHQKWQLGRIDMNADSEVLTFNLEAGRTFDCETWCITIPKCEPGEGHSVHLETLPPDSNPTTPCGDGWISVAKVSWKPTTLRPSLQMGQENYPNPFGPTSLFRTVIPFQTSRDGDATIRIVDEHGGVIVTNTQHVFGPGRHSFYFSGADLPAGTYYYTIEFPEGNVISARSMLLVK